MHYKTGNYRDSELEKLGGKKRRAVTKFLFVRLFNSKSFVVLRDCNHPLLG